MGSSAVLIVNPYAGRLSDASRDEVVEAVRVRFGDVEVVHTTGRDTGTDRAAKAAAEEVPLVLAFGGDGHVNEVVNGIAGTRSVLGIVPGGTMNVFARSLGIPRDPIAAIEHLSALGPDRDRDVNLGRMDDRFFTFAAGCGFDAEAAGLVERDVSGKRRFGEPFFYWSAFRVLTGSHRHRSPTMTLKGPSDEVPVSMAVACNTGPYAYLGGRAIKLTPDVRLDAGLDVFALRRMRIEALPMYAWRALLDGSMARHRDALTWHDVTAFTLSAPAPFARHVDGETLEPARRARFELARSALRVRA